MAAKIVTPSRPSVTHSQTDRRDVLGLARHKLLTESQVAEILRQKPDTLRKQRKTGRGPKFIRLGRDIRYSVPDLEEFLNARVEGPDASSQADEKVSA